jgi:hypothetical protein
MHAVVVLFYLFLLGGFPFRKGVVGDWRLIAALHIPCIMDGNRHRVTPAFIFRMQTWTRAAYRHFWPLEPTPIHIGARKFA